MKKLLVSAFALVLSAALMGQDSLLKYFRKPPAAAKPRVWWHWMSGNITTEGIRKDLLWMHRSGIGGFQNFDASLLTPQIIEKRLVYMTPEWQDAFRLTTRLADSLKLEMAIAGSPGWSESGGPWVKPEDGMKKLVWTETIVNAGAQGIRLAKQDGVTGPFQNIPMQPGLGELIDESKLPVFYRDVAVVAYKLPAADQTMAELGAVVSSSGGSFSLQKLTDGDLRTGQFLPRDSVKGYGWIQFTFPQPQTIKAVTMVGAGYAGVFGFGADNPEGRRLEASDDGVNFKLVTVIPIGAIMQQTINIEPTTAKYFRVTIKNPASQANIFAAMSGGDPGTPKAPLGTEIAEIVLHPVTRVHRFEEKDAFAPVMNLWGHPTVATHDVVMAEDVIDLTKKLRADGTLDWIAPEGRWNIVRFGYSLMGIRNHPATPEATGLEVDKLNPQAIKRYFTTYLDQYRKATGGLMGAKGLSHMVTDSWEAGAQNWTDAMLEEFQRRRGYSMVPWMPVLTGKVVRSAQHSEQFLFDLRKTLGEMVVEYHYDGLTDILKGYGMKRYTESHEDERRIIADGMEVKRTAAIPMAAMWTPSFMNGFSQHKYTMDIRESASVSHIYGQNIVAAESLTALGIGGLAWSYSPENLKSTADLELAHGLNRFVIHTSVHQPVDDKIPGLGLGPFGQWFNRHDTWAEQAKAWTDYLSRSSYLLQQGQFVAEVLVYYGEDNNITSLYREKPPLIPEGYNYDFVNADALLNKINVKDGKMITATGMRYHVLYIDSNAVRMTVDVLKKIHELAKAGVIIAGIKPRQTPSLSDDRETFERMVNNIWQSGKSNVSEGRSLETVLQSGGIAPDFEYSKTDAKTKLLYVHRRLKDKELYWINNRNNREEKLTLRFRVNGRIPQVWHPEDGRVEEIGFRMKGSVTEVDVTLTPNDAVFVVFGDRTTLAEKKVAERTLLDLGAVDGPWTVRFQPNHGAPAEIVLSELESLSKHSDPGVKYFSGTAAYFNKLKVESEWLRSNKSILLNLGEVKDLAEVFVNGQSAGIVWKTPFQLDIRKWLKAGENKIEIRVTNLWVNRLIGDAQPGAKKITYTTMPFYQASSPLLPSGLLGPVKVSGFRD